MDKSNKYSSAKIPIMIGVTGHRDPCTEDIDQLKALVRSELCNLIIKCPNSPLVMLNSLAEGSDQLCAEIAVEEHIPVIAALPFDIDEYRKDFSGDALSKFNNLISYASEVFTVPTIGENLNTELGFYYRQAGIYVATHSHVLLALWDGKEAQPDGCGTAETVDFMLNLNSTSKQDSIFKAAGEGSVIQIVTSRISDVRRENTFEVRLIENMEGLLDSILKATDCFNKEAVELKEPTSSLAIQKLLDETGTKAGLFNTLYEKADLLSLNHRNRYSSVIKWLAVFGVSLVLAFLLYDEMESDWFLPLYGIILIVSFYIFKYSGKNSFHRKYLEYRAFAETLRVQFYLVILGMQINVCDFFTWSQKNEIIWVKEAVTALQVGKRIATGIDSDNVKGIWIENQLNYHRKALKSVEKQLKNTSHLTKIIMVATVILYIVICILEGFMPEIASGVVSLGKVNMLITHEGQTILLRGLLKILLGVFSAVSLFLSSYFGKLSLQRKASDHKKMVSLYEAALNKWDKPGFSPEKVLIELAREEIVENGIWLSYCRDNSPGINI